MIGCFRMDFKIPISENAFVYIDFIFVSPVTNIYLPLVNNYLFSKLKNGNNALRILYKKHLEGPSLKFLKEIVLLASKKFFKNRSIVGQFH